MTDDSIGKDFGLVKSQIKDNEERKPKIKLNVKRQSLLPGTRNSLHLIPPVRQLPNFVSKLHKSNTIENNNLSLNSFEECNIFLLIFR